MKSSSYFIIISFLALWGGRVSAQKSDTSTSGYRAALSVYHSLLSPETGLYRGNEYLDYRNTITEGTPFFGFFPFDTGSVVYHNILYRNVFLAYDIIKEEVVIYDEPHLHKIALIKNEVSRFTASGSPFIHLTKDSAGAGRMKSGFYQVLYEGSTRILKKESRNIQERGGTTQTVIERYTNTTTGYFIEKNGVYYPANNKSSLLSVLKSKEKELQSFIRKKKLRFRKNKDSDFVQAAAYYDAITR